MLETQRRYQADSKRQAKTPFSGPFYWIPLPDGRWDFLEFVDVYYGDQADHITIWPEVVQILAVKWDIDPDELLKVIGDNTYGLPRGRVVKMGTKWGVAHGEDNPPGTDMKVVRRAFNLPMNTEFFKDEHEVTIQEEVNAVKNALSDSYEIQSPQIPDWEFGDYEDDSRTN